MSRSVYENSFVHIEQLGASFIGRLAKSGEVLFFRSDLESAKETADLLEKLGITAPEAA